MLSLSNWEDLQYKIQETVARMKAWECMGNGIDVWMSKAIYYTEQNPDGEPLSCDALRDWELINLLEKEMETASGFDASEDVSHITIRQDIIEGGYLITDIRKVDRETL